MSDTHPLQMRVPKQLFKEIKEYAAKRNMNVTQLTLDYYRRLIEADKQQEAEQV